MIAPSRGSREVRRGTELLARVVRSLLLEQWRLEQLRAQHLADVDELVRVGQLAREELVEALDQLGQVGSFLLPHHSSAGLGDRRERVDCVRREPEPGGSTSPCPRNSSSEGRTSTRAGTSLRCTFERSSMSELRIVAAFANGQVSSPSASETCTWRAVAA